MEKFNELFNRFMKASVSISLASFFLIVVSLIVMTMCSSISDYNNHKKEDHKPLDIYSMIHSLNVDTTTFNEKMLRYAGVDFPEVHILINFKESSACRGYQKGYMSGKKWIKPRAPTLCSDDWIDILGFNPYNYSGMKFPTLDYYGNRYRKTTAIDSIGGIYRRMLKDGFSLPEKYKWMHNGLLHNPHAVYASPYQHALDLKYRQEFFYKSKGYIPKRSEDYVEFLRSSGYNPYSKYYDSKRSGLKHLLSLWKKGTFHVKYGTYYRVRMNVTL